MTKAEPLEGAPRVLISAADVCRRVEELAAEVAVDLSGSAPVIVGILNGAAPFMMDLLRFLPALWRRTSSTTLSMPSHTAAPNRQVL